MTSSRRFLRFGFCVCFSLIWLVSSNQVVEPSTRVIQQSDQERQEIEHLIAILHDAEVREHDPDRLIKAIKDLSALRAAAAIDGLIRLLTFKRTFYWENSKVDILEVEHLVSRLDHYPAAIALFAIGKPSLRALVNVIESTEPGSLESLNAAETVSLIFRGDLAAGVQYLKECSAKADSHVGAYRLLEAATIIEEYRQRVTRN